MQENKITPFLWFDNQAEEAVKFYTGIFKNSEIIGTTYYSAGAPKPEGSVMSVEFILDGQEFIALNGGPVFTFNEAVSFSVKCKDQEEVDYYWDKFSEGGQPLQCGWIKDKFGLVWQIVPEVLPKLFQLENREKVIKVTEAMMKMEKLVIADLEKAGK